MTNLDAKIVGKISRSLSGRQPSVTTDQARQIVAQLRDSARRAPQIVQEVAELETAHTTSEVPLFIVDRQRWAETATLSFNSILSAVETPAPDTVTKMGDLATSAGLGAGLSVMAASVLGQYDPFSDRLALVAPNIVAFGRQYGLEPADLALWVSVHELTHAAQFAQAPWMRDYIISRVRPLLESSTADDFSLSQGPGGEITAIMSLLEGHAEYIMNQVPASAIPTRAHLEGAMRERRGHTNPIKALVQKATGMDLKMAQYSDGVAFVQGVIEEAGIEGLNQIWTDPLNVPSPEELTSPLTWVHRVL